MKKKLAVLLMLLVTVVLLFAACAKEKQHEHDFGEWIAQVDATCTEPGVKGHYTCAGCNKNFDMNEEEIESLAIPATGHTEETIVAIAPDCKTGKNGSTEGVRCKVCRETLVSPRTIEATHVLGEWNAEEAPTCTKAGVHGHYECSVCKKKFDADGKAFTSTSIYIPKLGHLGDWIIDAEATCTESGSKHRICSVCGETEKVTILSAGHTWSDWIESAPTCTEEGIVGHYHCSVCGKDFAKNKRTEITDDLTIPMVPHVTVIDRAVAPTCTTKGLTEGSHCLNCDTKEGFVAQQEVDMIAHTYGNWRYDKEATCTEAGSRSKVCECCGHIETETISAAHIASDWIVTQPATATEAGSKHKVCLVCGAEIETSEEDILTILLSS